MKKNKRFDEVYDEHMKQFWVNDDVFPTSKYLNWLEKNPPYQTTLHPLLKWMSHHLLCVTFNLPQKDDQILMF